MSLRARLLIAAVVLVAAGLLVADVATYRLLSSSLMNRVDQQLLGARETAAKEFAAESRFGRHPLGPDFSLPAGTYAELRDGSGTTLVSRFFGFTDQSYPAPLLPSDLPGAASSDRRTPLTLTATPAGQGSPSYRVLATGLGRAGGTLVVAIPLSDVTATLHRLLGVEVVVSVAVLLAIVALALWLVRIGLRPLEGIGETAGAIAAGDLTRRVEPADGRTEIGRLGLALNAMLAQIEAAFEERQASERRLRRFVADASHELRTPLTSIRGYAELFRRGAQSRPEDLAKSMQRIEAEASRMGILVDDLLLLARLDQGRPLEREPVDMAKIASDAVESARAVDPDRPIHLEVTGPARLMGDEGRLRQVVDNLLDNVRVHTPEGTPARVSVEGRDGEVVLSVSDEGPGLAAEMTGRVFERFYRGDPARSRRTGGVGLGLSIVSAIVEAHGGRVSAGSPGGGATFEITLPAHLDGAGQTSASPAGSPSAGPLP